MSRQPGLWLIVLQDHETQQSCSTTAYTLDEVWDRLETILCDPDAIWKDFKSYKGAGKKIRPK